MALWQAVLRITRLEFPYQPFRKMKATGMWFPLFHATAHMDLPENSVITPKSPS